MRNWKMAWLVWLVTGSLAALTAQTVNYQLVSTKEYTLIHHGLLVGANVHYNQGGCDLKEVPSNLVGASFIQTNELEYSIDHSVRDENTFLQFTINQPALVYVAYPQTGDKKPAWLANYTLVNDTIRTSGRTYMLFRKKFEAGTVNLGPCQIPELTGRYLMYFPIITPLPGPAEKTDLVISQPLVAVYPLKLSGGERLSNTLDYIYPITMKMPYFFQLWNQIELIAVGDSTIECGIDPIHFLPETNATTPTAFNLAHMNTDIGYVEQLTKEYLDHLPKLKWVVWGISPRIFNQYYNGFGLDGPGHEYDLKNADQLWAVPNPQVLKVTDLQPLFQTNMTPWGYFERTANGGDPTDPAQQAQKIADLNKMKARYKVDDIRWQNFERVIRHLTAKGIRVLVFTTPYHPIFAKTTTYVDVDGTPKVEFDQMVTRIQNWQTQIPHFYFADINQKGNHDLLPSDFIDWNHLNPRGAKKLTQKLELLRQQWALEP